MERPEHGRGRAETLPELRPRQRLETMRRSIRERGVDMDKRLDSKVKGELRGLIARAGKWADEQLILREGYKGLGVTGPFVRKFRAGVMVLARTELDKPRNERLTQADEHERFFQAFYEDISAVSDIVKEHLRINDPLPASVGYAVYFGPDRLQEEIAGRRLSPEEVVDISLSNPGRAAERLEAAERNLGLEDEGSIN